MHKTLAALLFFGFSLVGPSLASQSDADTIRSLRLENNRAIEFHNLTLMQRAWAPGIRLLESDGELFSGAKPLAASYAGIEFKDRDFVEYDRRPAKITISADGTRAAETGSWTAVYKTSNRGGSGVYLASWRKMDGDWKIIYEAYVSLASKHDKEKQPQV